MNNTLPLSILIAVISITVSCTRVITPDIHNKEVIRLIIDEEMAKNRFAAALSKVITKDAALRRFIKEEALREFDRDYDVFYPYVKDIEIHDGKTFRELLCECMSDPDELTLIERSVPTLTILVPDFSWIHPHCFSIKTWDTSIEDTCIGCDNKGDEHPLYYNGELVGKLKNGSFPDFPVLIVKSNERMRVVASDTRSGEPEYGFVSPVFDGSLFNGTRGYTVTILDNPDTSYYSCRDIVSRNQNYISTADLTAISPESIAAYNEFGTSCDNGVQRDYIYYGMSQSDSAHGILNNYERELLYRFCFATNNDIYDSSDSPDDPDPDLDKMVTPGKYYSNHEYSFARILDELWGTGQYEIKLEFIKGAPNGSVVIQPLYLHIPPDKLMHINHVRDLYAWTALGNLRWHEYTIQTSFIEPKWFYPGDTGVFFTINTSWNLATESDNVLVEVSEVDTSSTTSIQRTDLFKFSTNIELLPGTDSLIKVSLGTGPETSTNPTYYYYFLEDRNYLGQEYLNYIDNIVTGSGYYSNLGYGYQLNPVETAFFRLQFIPVDTRNQYSITQSIINR